MIVDAQRPALAARVSRLDVVRPGDAADPAVAGREQQPGGPRGGHVVEHHGVQVEGGGAAVHAHHGHVTFHCHLQIRVRGGRGDDHARHRLPHRGPEVLVLALLVPIRVAEHRRVPRLTHHVLDRAGHGRVERVLDVWDHHGDQRRPLGTQAPRAPVGDEGQLPGGLPDRLRLAGGDPVSVEHPGYRCRRHPGEGRHVVDGAQTVNTSSCWAYQPRSARYAETNRCRCSALRAASGPGVNSRTTCESSLASENSAIPRPTSLSPQRPGCWPGTSLSGASQERPRRPPGSATSCHCRLPADDDYLVGAPSSSIDSMHNPRLNATPSITARIRSTSSWWRLSPTKVRTRRRPTTGSARQAGRAGRTGRRQQVLADASSRAPTASERFSTSASH